MHWYNFQHINSSYSQEPLISSHSFQPQFKILFHQPQEVGFFLHCSLTFFLHVTNRQMACFASSMFPHLTVVSGMYFNMYWCISKSVLFSFKVWICQLERASSQWWMFISLLVTPGCYTLLFNCLEQTYLLGHIPFANKHLLFLLIQCNSGYTATC